MSRMGSDAWWRHRKRQEEKKPDSELSGRFLFKEGRPLAVLRPEDPARKLESVNKIEVGTPHEIAQPMFDAILNEQPHLFVGYLAKIREDGSGSGEILDKWGSVVDSIKPGDSFVGCGPGTPLEPPAFMLTGISHTEMWDGRFVLVLPRPDLKIDSNTGIIMASDTEGERGGIAIRGGCGTEVDCHIPTLNRIITGDPNKDYRTYKHEDKSHA